ncbi:cyclic nucleotide-binding domain-containing protein [Desulfopila inferna]|uniref:cyclic nucleotide-binding domain-containing protein n=1 Tax=Desulfopila inferna TaxID=468528 RepID=UPI0019653061|nr:cyclic nucleotide-binding domain-containing protein [Desulfopila inferna]MBM9604608.1 cyclic nucleotide-binding domain-containing protein [Desulfopila inferna]
MAEADKQQVALDVLKTLNAAVITTKLYPPRYPQVANAADNAFSLITEYQRKFGSLSFSLVDDAPKLCGLPVSKKTLGKMHGEDVFQQLRLLKLNHLVLERGISREPFDKLLTFFTTSPQLVGREGGGRAFVVNLGLNDLFPEEYLVELPEEREDVFAAVLTRLVEEDRVTTEDMQSVSTEIDGETVAGQKRISALGTLNKEPGRLTDILLAGIADALQGINRIGEISFPSSFTIILRNVNRFTDQEERESLAQSLAAVCARHFDDFALHLLLLQNYPGGFGLRLYDKLLAAIAGSFDDVVRLIREEEEVVARNSGKSSEQYKHIASAVERLFDSRRGQQYLVREKARELLETGEKERHKKRIQAGISGILHGDVNSLRNKEVVEHLPATVETLIARGKDKAAATIITNITTELIRGEQSSHDLLSECLSRIGESLISASKWDWLERLSKPLMAWLKEADRADEVCENIVEILLNLLKHYWKMGEDKKADKILQLIFAIRAGKLTKSSEMVAMVNRLQDLSVEKAPLPTLLARSVTEKNELIDRRLIMQGPLVARFLLNTLLDSDDAGERLKILDLLRRMGSLLPPLLLEKLSEPMPWYGKRNLIKLFSETGSKQDASKIFDYLNHEDIRVQQEALSCIFQLSGDDKKDNLLEALSLATGPMKEQVVRALSPMADEEVVSTIADLLGDWPYFSDDDRDPLLLQIVTLLGRGSSRSAEVALEEFLKNEGKGKARTIGELVWQATRQSVRHIKTMRRELSKRQIQETLEKDAGIPSPTPQQQKNKATFRTDFSEEALIAKLFKEGDEDRAAKLLVDLIDKASSLQRFSEAEALRDWLIETAPFALNDIIRTAEVIETAKREGISNNFLNVWSNLHDNLTTEEFNALYYSMEHLILSGEEVLVKQGDMSPALYFISSGKVKLFYDDKGTEILSKVIESGEIFGQDTFFDASVWTMTAVSLSRTEVSVLPLKNTSDWVDEQPALESKLHDLAKKEGGVQQPLKKVKSSRREHKRYVIGGSVLASILEKDLKGSGMQLRGDCADISRGGISFLIRVSNKKNARILLGRDVRLQLSCLSVPGKLLNIDGVLMTVRSLYSMNNDYSAHVRFHKPLGEEELRGILEAGEPEN